MRLPVVVIALIIAFCVFVGLGSCFGSDEQIKDVGFYLHRLRTLDHLPELDDSHVALAGTWDRLDGNWDAIDFRNVRGDLNTLLDVDGPGCVTRIIEGTLNNYGVPEVYGTLEGTQIRIYLDGNKKPIFNMPLNDFLDPDKGPFPNPITWSPRNGQSMPGVVFPIPYARHCRIELYNPQGKHWGSYWNIWYVTYRAGTRVKTLTWPLNATEKSELYRVRKTWLQATSTPPQPPDKWSKTAEFALKPNESRTIHLKGGGGNQRNTRVDDSKRPNRA